MTAATSTVTNGTTPLRSNTHLSFAVSPVRRETALRRVQAFERRFGQGVLHLAYHAALPVALDTGLLHLLRVNFFLDTPQPLHYTAESDLLLSPLCQEVGDDLYEIEPAIRDVLLEGFVTEYGQGRIREVAALLWQYLEHHAPWGDQVTLERAQQLTALNFLDPKMASEWMAAAQNRVGTSKSGDREWFVAIRVETKWREVTLLLDANERIDQPLPEGRQWIALAYTEPDEAAQELAEAMSKSGLKDRTRLLRLASLVKTLAEPLTQFDPLLVYARGISDWIQGDLGAAAAHLSKALKEGDQIQVAGVNLPLPEEILTLTSDKLNAFVLLDYPYPIAVNYRWLLETEGWEARIRKCIEVFEFGLRAITLMVLGQYLIRDVHQVSNPELDHKLYRRLAAASLGQWAEFFFLSLRAYRGQQKLFFMPELYDLYWDTSQEPHQPRKGLRASFDRLVQIRNDLAHRLLPEGEEAWEALGRDALGHLRTILAQFSFLQHYDLIRVVERRGDEYQYERYTGQEITTHFGRLRERGELCEGWFYLLRQDQSVLGLHPFFIFWGAEGEPGLDGEERRDVALFNRLRKDGLEYVAPVTQQMVEERDVDLFAQFRQLIYYNIEGIKMARKRTVLSWAGLRRAAEKLTAEQMATVREKYRRELYLQRDETFRKIEAFLASDKGCFVLTGKSGVGKSSFVLSLVDEFIEQEDVCLLIYDGARLSVPETMVRMISQDLARYLTLEGEASQDLFAELDRRGEMAEKRLIVVFDAINENVNGKALLRQIDQMMGEVRYLWLKVVITSRPQAWRTLKRGLRLAGERYYREPGSDEYWVELAEFAVAMEPFQRQELPRVYEKYRRVYGLQTAYADLPGQIRSGLRDPLMLQLVAEIYRGRSVPARIRVSDLYPVQHMEMLLRTGRLNVEDILFVEQELMPLMITDEYYSNVVHSSQIHDAQTRDGRPLWELIHIDEALSSGQRINESYVRLVDAEILTQLGTPTDYEICFKYERDYDYFAGKRLYQLFNMPSERSVEDKVAAYRELGARVGWEVPFLWGPLKEALRHELEAGETALAASVGRASERSLRSALKAALVEFAETDPGVIEGVVGTWLGAASHRSAKRDLATLGAGTLALEIAAQLHEWGMLEQAALMPSQLMRTQAVRHLYHLWASDPDRGQAVLQHLADRITAPRLLPDADALDACMGYSALVLLSNRDDPQTVGQIQRTWQGILNRFPFNLMLRRGGLAGVLSTRILDLWIGAAMRLRSLEVDSLVTNVNAISELDAFFRGNRHTREQVARLVNYLDPMYGDLRNVGDTILELAAGWDTVAEVIVRPMLLAHALRDPVHLLPLLQDAFDVALSKSPPTPYASGLIGVLQNILYEQDPIHPEWFDLTTEWMSRHMEASRFLVQTRTGRFRKSYLGWYLHSHYRFHGHVDSALVEEYLQGYHTGEDPKAMADFVACMGTLGMEMMNPRAVIQAVDAFCDLRNPEIADQFGPLLAMLRFRYPDLVDDFLEIAETSSIFRQQVRIYPPQETVGTLINRLATWAIRDTLVVHPRPWLVKHAQALLWAIAQSSRADEALRWALRSIVNIVYGEEPPTSAD